MGLDVMSEAKALFFPAKLSNPKKVVPDTSQVLFSYIPKIKLFTTEQHVTHA